MPETVTISKAEYLRLKRKAEINTEFLKELMAGIADIKAGRVTRVR